MDTGAPEHGHAIHALPDGRIVVAGEFDGAVAQVFLMLSDGSLDTSFGGGVGWVNVSDPSASFATANGLALAASGRYLIGGQGRWGGYDFWATNSESVSSFQTDVSSSRAAPIALAWTSIAASPVTSLMAPGTRLSAQAASRLRMSVAIPSACPMDASRLSVLSKTREETLLGFSRC